MTTTSSHHTSSLAHARELDAADPLREHRAAFCFPKVASVLRGTFTTPAATPSALDAATPAAPLYSFTPFDPKSSEAKASPIITMGSSALSSSVSAPSFRYFAGHSLGLQHVHVQESVDTQLAKWRDQAVEGHFHAPVPWFEVDDILRRDFAAIVGATTDEVVVMNTLTVNLHLLLSGFYRPSGTRRKILCEKFPFPSDMHALVSQVAMHGFNPNEDLVEVAETIEHPPATEAVRVQQLPEVVSTEAFLRAIDAHKDTAAVILLGGVHFLTGQYFDIEAIVKRAHQYGILVGVDAAHAAGNVPLKLHDWGVDFACWCTYKYLNAGPGNIAGAFVHERHFPALSTAIDTANDARVGAEHALATAIPTLRGWWGHHRASRFSLHRNFVPSVGAAVLQMSNPGVLGMMALAPALSLMARIGIENLRAKSLQLTRYMESLLVSHYAHALRLLTPTDPERRGAMLTLELLPGALRRELAATLHTSAYENGTASNANDADLLQRLLLERGHVMTDCRPPNIVRITPVSLYNSFEDVWVLCDLLGQLLKTKEEMASSSQ